LGGDPELLFFRIVFELKHIGLAADLAVLYIALAKASGFVYRGNVPLAATCTLEAGFHQEIVAGSGLALLLVVRKSGFLASPRKDKILDDTNKQTFV